ncbi:MAG: magnesium transporter [Beijerinckiaceae bacterium]
MTDATPAASAVDEPHDVRDEHGDLRESFVAEVAAAVAAGNAALTRELAGDLHEADVGSLLEALEQDQRTVFITLLGEDFDFIALTEVSDAMREEILEELPTEAIVEGMSELEADDAVAILEDLNEEDQQEILEAMPPEDQVALRRSLDYPEESAGRLMQTTMVMAPPFWTAGQMLDHIHDVDESLLPDEFYEVFVVDPAHRFLGNVFLDTLVRARRTQPLEELMDRERFRVGVTDDQEEVARLFERYNLVSVPVVDEGERLVGVITIDDIVDVIQQEADEDVKALGGVRASEELSDSVLGIARSRFLWLFVNLLTAFAAAFVIGQFEGQIQKMVALAVLVPIVASQGGNAATQTMTVAVRALATRELSRTNAPRIVRRELLVGLINGLGFGLITGIGATIWFGMPVLGLVIALAMTINLAAGVLGGVLVPMLLDRYELDPAVSSGAFVTTVTDVVGNFAFLGLATLIFKLW